MSPTNDPAASFTRDQSADNSSLSPADTFPGERREPADNAPPVIPGYTIDAVLGRGGMGVVYRGTQTLLRRPAAIKVLLGGGHAGHQAVARLKTEAATVAALDHPNVVRVYDAGETNGVPYLAMELAPAGCLEDRLKGKPMPLAEALAVMRAVAAGVGAAHALGIVHRDLKPGNVLFAADGTPKVADFGLAKSAETDSGLTGTGSVIGTPAYMSPEQALGKTKLLGPRSDVWAIGVMLYECLTGAVPFAGESLFDTLDKVRQGKVVPPRKLNPHIPEAVEEVILKCLRKLPEERFADAGEIAAALTVATPTDVRPAMAPPANRKLVIGLGVAVAVLLAAVVAMAVWPRPEVVRSEKTAIEQPPPKPLPPPTPEQPPDPTPPAGFDAPPKPPPKPNEVVVRPQPQPPAEVITPPPAVPAKGTTHALLVIGANDRDPQTAATLFTDLNSWRAGLVGLVPQKNLKVIDWLAARPVTADQVRTELADLARRAGPADTVVAVFVGNGRAFGGLPGYVFYDLAAPPPAPGPADVLSVDEVTRALAGGRARANLVFWDASRAAAGTPGPAARPDPSPAVTVLFAGKDGQGAHEHEEEGSVFSRAATRAITRVSHNRRVTIDTLTGLVALEYKELIRRLAGHNSTNNLFRRLANDPTVGPEVVGGPPADTPLFVRE